MSIGFDSLGSIKPSAVVAEVKAQLRIDLSVILERRANLSKETDLWLSRIGKQLAPLDQNNSANPVHASGLKARRWLA